MVTLELISENEDQKSPALHNFLKNNKKRVFFGSMFNENQYL